MRKEKIILEFQNKFGELKTKRAMYIPTDYSSFLKHSYNAAKFFSINPKTNPLIQVMIVIFTTGSKGASSKR